MCNTAGNFREEHVRLILDVIQQSPEEGAVYGWPWRRVTDASVLSDHLRCLLRVLYVTLERHPFFQRLLETEDSVQIVRRIIRESHMDIRHQMASILNLLWMYRRIVNIQSGRHSLFPFLKLLYHSVYVPMLLECVEQACEAIEAQHPFLEHALTFLHSLLTYPTAPELQDETGHYDMLSRMEGTHRVSSEVLRCLTMYWMIQPLDLERVDTLFAILDVMPLHGRPHFATFCLAASVFKHTRSSQQPNGRSMHWMSAGILTVLALNSDIIFRVCRGTCFAAAGVDVSVCRST